MTKPFLIYYLNTSPKKPKKGYKLVEHVEKEPVVKKLTSKEPLQYTYLSLELALERYDAYIDIFMEMPRKFKSFTEWLRTEI